MHVEQVEIYSDKTNAAILRHPGRRFPGVLVQGDSLCALCVSAHDVCVKAKSQLDDETFAELDKLRLSLLSYLTHYKVTLGEHNIPLPFNDVQLFLSG